MEQCEEKLHHNRKEALAMVYALHKYCHYLFNNKFIFYVDHMALHYLVKKPQVSSQITRWLLLFLKYDFSVVYKLGKSHSIMEVLSYFSASYEPSGVLGQITDAPLLYSNKHGFTITYKHEIFQFCTHQNRNKS
jgi:hypothetical protein